MSGEDFDYYLQLIKNTLEDRGSKYNDAFHKTFIEYGLDTTRILLTIKLNRLKNIEFNNENLKDIEDTLIDIAGYCILSLIEMNSIKRKDQ